MTILVSGGGTGGHVTPILAVAYELKKLNPDCRIIYVGERGGKFQSLLVDHSAIDEVRTIFAGKFRRYHGDSWLKRIIDFKTFWQNIRDVPFVVIGIFQAMSLVRRIRPDVIFLKGGYVGVPIGLAAAAQKIPFVTHDSDSVPGLANRMVSRWATLHATGMPTEYYSYPKQKTYYVGVLVGGKYHYVDETQQTVYRRELRLPEEGKILLVTGGSLGALRLNEAFDSIAHELLEKFPDLTIIHQVGKGNLAKPPKSDGPRYIKLEFMEGMYRYTGAADVVVTRAGANTLAELGAQGKACVVVPNHQLTGGHQLKNADYLVQNNAVLVIDEKSFSRDTSQLQSAIEKLLEYPVIRFKLAQTLRSVTKIDATKELAVLLLKIGTV